MQCLDWRSLICGCLVFWASDVRGQLPESPLRPSGLSNPAGSNTPVNSPLVNPALGNAGLGNPGLGNTGLGNTGLGNAGLGAPQGSVSNATPNLAPLPVGGLLAPSPNPAAAPSAALMETPPSNRPLDRGVVTFESPAEALAAQGRSPDYGIQQTSAYELEAGDWGDGVAGLSPLEQRYSAWWREVLAKSPVEGQPLELKGILQSSAGRERVAMIREYWRLSEAILAVQILREAQETWRSATAAQAQQSLVQTVSEMLRQQIEQAQSLVEAEQEHLGLWLGRYNLPTRVRPVDAPYLGPYDTKLPQLQQQGQWTTDLAVLAQTVDTMKREIVDDALVIDWAETEWERARASGDLSRMAGMIQLRQTAYLLWLGRVTRYNEAIARYAYAVAGPGVPVQRQLAMLLRQPLVDGRLTDIRTDAWFQSPGTNSALPPGSGLRDVAPVGYDQPLGGGAFVGQAPAAATPGNWQPARGR